MKFSARTAATVDAVLAELQSFDLIVDERARVNSVPGSYINAHRHEYLRTVTDILACCPPPARVLEIGAFFGVVSIALARLGYTVTAADVPEYMDMPEQIRRFGDNRVTRASVRLQDYRLPFEEQSFEAIIMCEVLEHLNFNPLPLLKEINRIGTLGSVFYLSQPNLASRYNRVALLRGRPIQVSVQGFFAQLDPTNPEIANGHWREYTREDIRQMLEPLGFRIEHQYYFSLGEMLPVSGPRRALAALAWRAFPSLKENLTTIAVKAERTRLVFQIPPTVHQTLREL